MGHTRFGGGTMLKFFSKILISILVLAGTAQAEFIPWPWGALCPLAVDNIDGPWIAVTSTGAYVFNFTTLSRNDNGVSVIRIEVSDVLRRRLALGYGQYQSSLGTLTSLMIPTVDSKLPYMTLTVQRANESKGHETCGEHETVTVVTMTVTDSCGTHDFYYQISRMNISHAKDHSW